MTRPTTNQWFFGSLSLAGTLLSVACGFIWSKVDAHDDALPRLEERQIHDNALLKEVRDDVKEILGAVNRLQGANDVARKTN